MLTSEKILTFAMAKRTLSYFSFFDELNLENNQDYIKLCSLLPKIFKNSLKLSFMENSENIKLYTRIIYNSSEEIEKISFHFSTEIKRNDIEIFKVVYELKDKKIGFKKSFSNMFLISNTYELIPQANTKRDKILSDIKQIFNNFEIYFGNILDSFILKEGELFNKYYPIEEKYFSIKKDLKNILSPSLLDKNFFEEIDISMRKLIDLKSYEFSPKMFISSETKFNSKMLETDHIEYFLVLSFCMYPEERFVYNLEPIYLGHLVINCHNLETAWETYVLNNYKFLSPKLTIKKFISKDLGRLFGNKVNTLFEEDLKFSF